MRSIRRILGFLALGFAVSQVYGAPVFFGTTHADSAYLNWQVATNRAGSVDGPNSNGVYNSFPIDGSISLAVACTNIPVEFFGGGSPVRPNWITNESDCSSGTNTQKWTHYIFRQSFTLDSKEAATLELTFQWAADDSGQVLADRGAWTPRWSLDSLAQADLVTGNWPRGDTYSLGPAVSVSGFHEGIDTMYFWVQGDGIIDGMMLTNAEFSIKDLPVPGALTPVAFGVLGSFVAWRRAALRKLTYPGSDKGCLLRSTALRPVADDSSRRLPSVVGNGRTSGLPLVRWSRSGGFARRTAGRDTPSIHGGDNDAEVAGHADQHRCCQG